MEVRMTLWILLKKFSFSIAEADGVAEDLRFSIPLRLAYDHFNLHVALRSNDS
jgi:hypothetical protein